MVVAYAVQCGLCCLISGQFHVNLRVTRSFSFRMCEGVTCCCAPVLGSIRHSNSRSNPLLCALPWLWECVSTTIYSYFTLGVLLKSQLYRLPPLRCAFSSLPCLPSKLSEASLILPNSTHISWPWNGSVERRKTKNSMWKSHANADNVNGFLRTVSFQMETKLKMFLIPWQPVFSMQGGIRSPFTTSV